MVFGRKRKISNNKARVYIHIITTKKENEEDGSIVRAIGLGTKVNPLQNKSSHDSDFLDNVCTDMIHLENKKLSYCKVLFF